MVTRDVFYKKVVYICSGAIIISNNNKYEGCEIMSNENDFRDWLAHGTKHEYGNGTIDNYICALKNANTWFNVELPMQLLDIDTVSDFEKILSVIKSVKDYDILNKDICHSTFSSAAARYQEYLETQYDFTWIDFYTKFADKLRGFRNDRKTLIEKLIKAYDDINIKFPKLENTNLPFDVDPFTVFGLFNKGISESNRIKIITALAKEFEVNAKLPTFFSGIPVLNNLKATFYCFQDVRGEHDVDNLWNLFEIALTYALDQSQEHRNTFIKAFDTVIAQIGIRWNITMGLFWIRPYVFLNLDSRNRWFITKPNNITEDFVAGLPKLDTVPSAIDYLSICDSCAAVMKANDLPFSNYPELSAYAWKVSKKDNEYAKSGCKDDTDVESHSDGNIAVGDKDVRPVHYWFYEPGHHGISKWEMFYSAGVMGIGWSDIGDLKQYSSKEEMRQAMQKHYGSSKSYRNVVHATWRFANELKPGDIVFVKNGKHTLIGRGIVTSEYRYDEEITDDYKNLRNVKWTHNGEWSQPSTSAIKGQPTLTDITQHTDFIEKLKAIFDNDEETEDAEEPEIIWPRYTPEDFLAEVYMSNDDYKTLVAVLKKKKNIILQGAPGVGKTFAAKRLAYSIMGEKNTERVQMIQFHQSYSYEDFIEGYRPADKNSNGSDFIIKRGSFYNFCRKAAADDENDYFFIIDEINRGNLSKIFGELFMLIETDKRGLELQLLYSDEKFSVPDNVYIIGMMNTADRSLAMLDYALRRRFSFVEMKPGFETEDFIKYKNGLASDKFNRLISCVVQLNTKISEDTTLGEGFCIGHSYFCNLTKADIDGQALSDIVKFELIPLLKEYWFDDADKVKEWADKLTSAIK